VCSATGYAEDSPLGALGRELTALDTLGRLTAESADLDEVLRLALDTIREITGLEVAYVSLFDQEVGELELVACAPSGQDLCQKASRTALSRDLVAEAVHSGQVVVVEDTWGDPRFSDGAAEQAQVRSFAAVPLKSRGNVLGVLSVGSPEAFRLSSDLLSYLSVVAGQLSWSIESTLLRERLDSSRFRLRERVKELSILYDISRESLVTENVGSFLSFVARRLPTSMQYQKAMAVVYCVIGGRDYVTWSDNVDEAMAKELRIVPGEGTLGELLVERGALIEYGIAKLAQRWKDCGVESVLAVPIAIDGETTGSISVYYLRDSWRFLEEESHLLRGISEQVAQYLARDAFARENERHVQEVSTLFEVSKALASVVDIEEMLPAIRGTLMETLRPAEAGVLFLFD
jgi:GAF domain-containing protein